MLLKFLIFAQRWSHCTALFKETFFCSSAFCSLKPMELTPVSFSNKVKTKNKWSERCQVRQIQEYRFCWADLSKAALRNQHEWTWKSFQKRPSYILEWIARYYFFLHFWFFCNKVQNCFFTRNLLNFHNYLYFHMYEVYTGLLSSWTER